MFITLTFECKYVVDYGRSHETLWHYGSFRGILFSACFSFNIFNSYIILFQNNKIANELSFQHLECFREWSRHPTKGLKLQAKTFLPQKLCLCERD